MRPITRGLPTIHFEIGELEYSIRVTRYSPPTRDTHDEPGDTGECELAPFATISVNGVDVGEVPYSVLLLDCASFWYSVTPDPKEWDRRDQAERSIYDKAMEACADMEPDEPEYDEDVGYHYDEYRFPDDYAED
jgi:hypothetical protein